VVRGCQGERVRESECRGERKPERGRHMHHSRPWPRNVAANKRAGRLNGPVNPSFSSLLLASLELSDTKVYAP
jgi:hypothetical protein